MLELLTSRTFAARDFFETRQGVCRVVAPLTHELGETATEWGRLVGRVAEDVARKLEPRSQEGRAQPTPITGRRRSVGRPARSRISPSPVAVARPAHACLWCGKQLRGQRRTCRGECEDAIRAEGLERFTAAGARALEQHRGVGTSEPWTDADRERLGQAEAERIRQAREWQRQKRWPADLGLFVRAILPALADLSAGELARRTGLSKGYCWRIKKGLVVPHPMWWERLTTRM